MNILIVDDDVIFRTGLAKAIPWQELGFILLEPAASAGEALARISPERPDLLITDFRMTGENGIQLAELVKARWPDIEVIVLTDAGERANGQQALRDKVIGFLPKTGMPDDIIRTVLEAKEKRRARRKANRGEAILQSDEKTSRLIRWIAEGMAAMADPGLLSHREGPWQVLLVAATGWDNSERDWDLLRDAVLNALLELLPGDGFGYGDFAVLIQPASRSDDESELRRKAARRLEEALGCRIAMAAGMPVLRPEQLHRSFLTAREALAHRLNPSDLKTADSSSDET